MNSNSHSNNVDDNEMFLVSLHRQIPLKHLNLIYFLDNKLDECISTKYEDISNIIQVTYRVKYNSTVIQAILNLLKSDQASSTLFSLENTNEIINNYSKDHHFLTFASLHTIKPFTLFCLFCQQPLKLQFKEKVNVFLIDRVDNGVIYSAHCCHVQYYPNSYVKSSKRYVIQQSLYNQKYVYFSGKSVLSIDVVLHTRQIWSICDRDQRNRFFTGLLPQLERHFTLFWSSHSLKLDCGDIEWGCGTRPEMIRDEQNPGYWKNCSYCPQHRSLENNQSVHGSIDQSEYDVIDCNVSRTDRYCSRRTSYGIILTICEAPIRVLHHLFTTIENMSPNIKSLPKYLIYDNACGLLLTFRNRLQNGRIRTTTRTDAL
ncbi:unnamed protein product [Rotaria sordida]|uniref:Uncharacterized protein n=1 Tax=Rotaria sordida TaxID=392033 RepID=A0A819QPK5_9BILA|nr:unnamed protein product [Rotaria sordida]